MNYEELQKALEVLDIVTRITQSELKERYLELSRIYHPDMPEGNEKKFKEINEAYKLVDEYMQNYRFSFDEDEFYTQNPFSRKSKDWFYNF
ncbi:DnaJ domain-containing protein [Sulfurimonas sp.]|uniref:DnaJ domain-containing protein n=1 Tax=Sulfurimonas sp. TaxID=2022749 RepID=UPI0025E192BA|nr:DnaJ domain-containing protein [Sulfurimonas sp.]MCK9454085.1 DnaJ domain-containing protein [Sulfurimonas sp.]